MTTSKETLENIAYENGLELVTVTQGSNGYPQGLKHAVIGFDSFEQAEELKKKHPGLDIVSLHKQDGWQFYTCQGTAWEPYNITESDYGDDYTIYPAKYFNPDDFIRDEVTDRLADLSFSNFDDLEKFIADKREIFEELETAGEDELVVTNEGRYFETVESRPMRHSFDTHHWEIGITY